MKKFLKNLIIVFLSVFFIFNFALAQENGLQDSVINNLEQTSVKSGYINELAGVNLTRVIGEIINGLLGLVGIIFVGLFIYGGYLWMVSGGEKNIEKARDIMTSAVIGIIVILTSYAISNFIINTLIAAQAAK